MILQGNSYRIPLKDESVHSVITSFPYFNLRSYDGIPPTIWGGDSRCAHAWDNDSFQRRSNDGGKTAKQLSNRGANNRDEPIDYALCTLCGAFYGCFGLEPSINLHVQNAVAVCREIKRVLRKDGIFLLNYGDSYSGGKNGRSAADTRAAGNDDRTFRDKPFSVTELPAKNLCMIPARVAIALQEDGWVLRSEMGWYKGNAMPSSVTDRPGTAHEHVFMLVKSSRYYYDSFAVRKAGKEWTGQAGTFNRTNGKNTKLEVPGQAYVSHRERDDRVPSGRAFRTSDPFFDSLDAYIAHLQAIRDNGGLLLAEDGTPAALVVNSEPFSGGHYAVFPRKLVAPLVKVTPEKVCPNCNSPWRRIKEPTPEYAANFGSNNGADHDRYGKGYKKHSKAVTAEYITTGWRPSCKCNLPESECIGGVILDCFAGSGTVGAVCNEHGRRFVGIDLSATYLSENALSRSEKKTSAKLMGQLPMFAKLDEVA